MKKNLKITVALLLLLSVMSACVPLVIGGASGGAVYSGTSDHIEDVFSISKEQAFETMIGLITKDEGQIKVSSITDGKIHATIGKTLLYVTITPVDDMTIKVSIRAKKKHIELIPDKESAVRYYRAFVKAVMK